MYKKTILIDLDGVLNNYNGHFDLNNIPEIKDGAKNFLKTLYNTYKIKIFTTRDKEIVIKWIKKYNVQKYISDITNIKEPAWLHVDDRCIKFDGNY